MMSTDQIFHIIMPRNSRVRLVITVPSHISFESMRSSIGPALKRTMDSSYIEILKFSQMEPKSDDEPNKITYEVIYLNIQNKLIDKLREANIKKGIFYVGLSEDENKFLILNSVPLVKELALTNRMGLLYPYTSEIITIS